MTKDMKLSELADELTSAIRIGVEDDVTIPFELSVRILTALRDSTDRDAVLEEAARVVANKVAEGVFIQTRHACALRVEGARDLLKQSSLQRDHPAIASHIDALFDGFSAMICEVLLDPTWTEEALATLAAERRIIALAAGGSHD